MEEPEESEEITPIVVVDNDVWDYFVDHPIF